jgi:phage gpG-like protein
MTTAARVAVLGLADMADRVRGISEAIDKNVALAVRRGAIDIQRTAVVSIQQGAKGGRTYKLWNPKRVHIASAPGEPPATDRGKLASSIKVATDPGDDRVAYVYTTQAYGRHLEFGTRGNGKGSGAIAARPWLFPAYEANRERVSQNVRKAFFLSVPTSAPNPKG